MSRWEIIKPFFFSWILFEILGILGYIFATRDGIVLIIMVNVAMIPLLCILLSELFKKCPICGKRHLLNEIRCGGDRYTLYDAYCPVHKQWMEIEWDRHKGKYTYFKRGKQLKWDECREIIPIWKQK